MIVIAHRGALNEALENSIEAFDLAVAGGATRLEFDVHATSDGRVAVIHDYSFARTAGFKKKIEETHSNEFTNIRLNNSEPIPFLEEVLERYLPKTELNIEIKGRGTATAQAVGEMLKNSKHLDKVIISSFKSPPLRHIGQNFPDLKIACLFDRGYHSTRIFKKEPSYYMNKVGAKIIHPWVGMVNPKFMKYARENNWLVFPYCERKSDEESNREKLWQRLLNCKIDGLCTNYPRELNLWLKDAKIK